MDHEPAFAVEHIPHGARSGEILSIPHRYPSGYRVARGHRLRLAPNNRGTRLEHRSLGAGEGFHARIVSQALGSIGLDAVLVKEGRITTHGG